MSKIAVAAITIAILLVVTADARAVTYADGVTLDASFNASITNLSNSANGTSEIDNSLAVLNQQGGTSTLIYVTYDFPDFSVGIGTQRVYLVVDSTVVGTVSARVTQVNGDTSYASTSAVSISGTTLSDKHFGIDFDTDEAMDITSVSFLITLADSSQNADLRIDAVALPEPGTWLLFALGATGLGAWSLRRRILRRGVRRTS